MRTLPLLCLLAFCSTVFAQNVAINSDGSDPNSNAALDVKSPATGEGKGLLIPRMTLAQRTVNSTAGGLLDGSGNLHGGAAQGLIVYQTDGNQGIYYNTSATAVPSWIFLTESTLPVSGTTVAVGDSATTTSNGVAVGVSANGSSAGLAVGYQANANSNGSAVGYQVDASFWGSALGYKANANTSGVALGYMANGYDYCTAVGYQANGYVGTGPYSGGTALGYKANSFSGAGKYSGGTAVGYMANARHNVNENDSGAVAVGFMANSYTRGAAVGWKAAGFNQGSAVGFQASGSNYGAALGYMANGAMGNYATAVGYRANGGGTKNFTFAKGAYSRAERYNEEWKGADTIAVNPSTGALSTYNKFGYGQVNFNGSTTSASATEIFLGGQADQRFTLKDNSALTFQMLVTAINTNTGDTSGWRCWGLIKRRAGAATTALVGSVSTDATTQGGLTTNPTITADTTNGALKLQVTGVNLNTVIWNAMVSYSEVRE